MDLRRPSTGSLSHSSIRVGQESSSGFGPKRHKIGVVRRKCQHPTIWICDEKWRVSRIIGDAGTWLGGDGESRVIIGEVIFS